MCALKKIWQGRMQVFNAEGKTIERKCSGYVQIGVELRAEIRQGQEREVSGVVMMERA